ncbi:universal stress protein [Halorarius halobius]|uniref:universal stress protein n=1 Tax=Halorarius halobius TaxID=2962671 RepID=UPI0020CEB10C|nr:universal stress protein [Halorarius halobius]
MFETVVIATDGSESGRRAVDTALDLAERFDAAVHALYVVDRSRYEGLPEDVGGEVERALGDQAEEALDAVESSAAGDVTTAVREGRPANKITAYAREVDADVVATGTRGRDGEHSFLLGSVAEHVVRTCPVPVLTVRQLESAGA